jgi:hypothetical protein
MNYSRLLKLKRFDQTDFPELASFLQGADAVERIQPAAASVLRCQFFYSADSHYCEAYFGIKFPVFRLYRDLSTRNSVDGM